MTHITEYIAHSLQGIYSSRELQSLTLIICKEVLRLDDSTIYLRKDIKLSDNQQELLQQTVKRLRNNEPLQYVRSTADFYGLAFHVEPGALIPRPETEELVDLILKENSGSLRILDMGTGSGCIAITLARHLPQATVDAWDVSEAALNIARLNADKLNACVNFSLKDILTASSPTKTYDIIVSNPPYITEAEKKEMEKNVLDWEPELALFVPDSDPLRFYRRIAQLGVDMLVPGGRLYFEINQHYGEEMINLLANSDYKNIRLIKDVFNNNRIVTGIR